MLCLQSLALREGFCLLQRLSETHYELPRPFKTRHRHESVPVRTYGLLVLGHWLELCSACFYCPGA